MMLAKYRLKRFPNSKKSALITAAAVICFELFNTLSTSFGFSSVSLNNTIMLFAILILFILLNFPLKNKFKEYLDFRTFFISCLFTLSSYFFWDDFPLKFRIITFFSLSYLFLLSLKEYILIDDFNQTDCSPKFMFLLSFAVYFICLSLVWVNHFPYNTSPDTVSQWDQLHGIVPYNNAFTAGYVVFLKLLLKIVDNYGIVIFVDILLISLLYACFTKYLSRQGISICYLLALPALICGFSCTQAFFYAWKDVPFSICVGVLTLYLMKINDDDYIFSYKDVIFIGISIAFSYLFRHNGIVLSVFTTIVFVFIMLRKKLIKKLVIMLIILFVCITSVNLYSKYVLRPVELINGTEFWPLMTGVAAAVADGRNVSATQLEEISEIYDINFMKSKYNVYNKLDLITDGICYDHHNGYYCMANYAPQTIKYYFELLPSNLHVMFTDFLGNAMVVLGTVTFAYYEHNIVYMLLLFYLVMLYHKKRGRLFPQLYCIVPILLNAATIMVAVISYEQRYILSTFMLFPFIAAYIKMKLQTNNDLQ